MYQVEVGDDVYSLPSPKKKTKKQKWFHVSDECLGDPFTFNPRNPYGWDTSGEPCIPRICVAPTPQHCLGAIRHRLGASCHYIYVTEEIFAYHPIQQRFNSVTAYNVWEDTCNLELRNRRYIARVTDAEITQERWLLEDTAMSLYAVITYEESISLSNLIPYFSPGDPRYFEQQLQGIEEMEELLKDII
jgi:hypothetical protein